ncbi:hypothetical protein BDF22DRAFT_775154 [Syncephalis plumigaleata]|nr:hypothetical protein BDF22DRAFT_775154 [Syncephalis plumigaleata]
MDIAHVNRFAFSSNAYEVSLFNKAIQELNRSTNSQLSAFYFESTKERLYVDDKLSLARDQHRLPYTRKPLILAEKIQLFSSSSWSTPLDSIFQSGWISLSVYQLVEKVRRPRNQDKRQIDLTLELKTVQCSTRPIITEIRVVWWAYAHFIIEATSASMIVRKRSYSEIELKLKSTSVHKKARHFERKRKDSILERIKQRAIERKKLWRQWNRERLNVQYQRDIAPLAIIFKPKPRLDPAVLLSALAALRTSRPHLPSPPISPTTPSPSKSVSAGSTDTDEPQRKRVRRVRCVIRDEEQQ